MLLLIQLHHNAGISVGFPCYHTQTEQMGNKLTQKFRSIKPCRSNSKPPITNDRSPSNPPPPAHKNSTRARTSRTREWSVYLIVSIDLSRTYVGVTTDFNRRLKQHNGELKGGAKASRAGRPWSCACIVRGFKDQSEACEFESKWKSFSRKLPRARKRDIDKEKAGQTDLGSASVIKHRQAALSRAKGTLNCSDLVFEWQWDTP